LDFRFDREHPFSFDCQVCGNCCSDKVIMAGPHEILGMSRVLGITTTELLARYADNGGTTLRFGSDGRCAFVAPSGCKVHAHRPLACRLFPLGRAVDELGAEKFALVPKPDNCQAAIGTDGTIESFLESQGVGPYIEWSRRYSVLYKRMLGLLDRMGVEGNVGTRQDDQPGGVAAETIPVGAAPISTWQDIDASLAGFCSARGLTVPSGIEAAIDLHLAAIGEWLDGLERKL
jgi:Fe-S-cluster containining protein